MKFICLNRPYLSFENSFSEAIGCPEILFSSRTQFLLIANVKPADWCAASINCLHFSQWKNTLFASSTTMHFRYKSLPFRSKPFQSHWSTRAHSRGGNLSPRACVQPYLQDLVSITASVFPFYILLPIFDAIR